MSLISDNLVTLLTQQSLLLSDDKKLAELEAANAWFEQKVKEGVLKRRGNTLMPLEKRMRRTLPPEKVSM